MAVNEEQAADWNGDSGREFVEQRERLARILGPFRERVLAAAEIQDGDRVLDVGCGCGELTVEAARACGSGHSLGVDLSRVQVAEARRLAARSGVGNARFEVADVQVHPFGAGEFDVVMSSFGVMFFDDPAAAFRNMRSAVRRGGMISFVCWRTPAENPYFTVGYAGAASDAGLIVADDAGAPFSLAEPSRVRILLNTAGFGDIRIEELDLPMLIGSDVEDVLDFERRSPSTAGILNGLRPARIDELTAVVRARLAPYASPDGVVMPGAAWLVTGRAT